MSLFCSSGQVRMGLSMQFRNPHFRIPKSAIA
jgi:hypothetical protein